MYQIEPSTIPKKDSRNRMLGEDIKEALKTSVDGILVLNKEGHVILANEQAERCFPESRHPLTGQHLSEILPQQTWAEKRFFVKMTRYFNLAFEGIPQQFYWIIEENKRPLKASNVILNTLYLDNQRVMIARFIDITSAKIMEWVLRSLAGLSNHVGINDIVDEIVGLAAKVFSAEYAAVVLIDNADIAHSVSFFHKEIKQKNTSYPLKGTPCEKIKQMGEIYHFNGDVYRHFPQGYPLNLSNIHGYIGGPIKNAKNQIIGLVVLLSNNHIAVNAHNKTLFMLFIERINLEIERLLAHRKLQFLASIPLQNPNPIFRIKSDGTMLYANHFALEIIDNWQRSGIYPPKALMKACEQVQKEKKVVCIEIAVADKTYLFSIVFVPDFDQITVYATDVTALKQVQKKMLDLANIDSVTTIANRQLFETTIHEWIDSAKKDKRELALLLLDIDNFKMVNDIFGHDVGDKLLKILAKRVSGCIRKEDFIARIGGDEFVVLLKLSNKKNIEKIAYKINQALASPFELGQHHIETACSIGISYYPDAGNTPSDLLKNADFAMYQAKKSGKNQYAVYQSPEDDHVHNHTIILKTDLKSALEKQQFHIDYQPQFDLHSQKIVGFEAFIRWQHPQKGLIPPTEVIPLAEQTGFIHSLGYWTINQALKDYSSVINPLSKGKISLNIAVSQLNDKHFVENLCRGLSQANIPFDSLILDISEQISALQYRYLDDNLSLLKAQGISLSLDNFSRYQSNLGRLLEVPFSYLKIDQNLAHTLEQHPRQGAFISGIIDMASKLDLRVIQKGVENAYQNDALKQLGCHYAQGFFYCPPLSIKNLERFITDYYR